jgi:hypothetical protein
MIAMSGTIHAEPPLAAKDIVIVHGAPVDGSAWRAVHDILSKDGFHVTIVQESLTGLKQRDSNNHFGRYRLSERFVGHTKKWLATTCRRLYRWQWLRTGS